MSDMPAAQDPSDETSKGPGGESSSRPVLSYDDPYRDEILKKLDFISDTVKARLVADLASLDDFLRSTRRLLITNFLAGLARGVGFLLGVTLVGGSVVWIAAVAFDKSMEALKQDVNLDTVVEQVAEIRSKLIYAFSEIEAPVPPPRSRPVVRPTPTIPTGAP